MPTPHQPDPPSLAADRQDRQAPVEPPRLRRAGRRWLLLCAFPALVAGCLLAALWTGSRLYEQPFVWYNLNRIDAVANRTARSLDSVTVVAFGDTALRDATLDERDMAALGAKRGVANLHFLRIVHHRAEFADFEPLLDRVLAIKPALVLIDRDLLTAERGVVEDLTRYLRVLASLPEGRAYLQDQAALQYQRNCGTPASDSQTAMGRSSDAAERVRAFMTRAWAAGIQVALVQVRKPSEPAVIPASAGDLPLWHDVTLAGGSPSPCSAEVQAADGRTAFSAWLAGGIANVVTAPRPAIAKTVRTEAASLP
ncbi:hypothetical protein MCW82_20515 [Azospirillum doebereinerae]|uniref:hypothetical protein n=1 Tax=Azospirillum doebereinerae TaxID=92933 RepID=UPI001EE554D0|nr:hypothetical protein [Azospirillum doebereinerae]MCG5242164.1 hypothetical protein [Azospirillum doebereinerae]